MNCLFYNSGRQLSSIRPPLFPNLEAFSGELSAATTINNLK